MNTTPLGRFPVVFPRRPGKTHRSDGFSLVEVALALGLMGFTCVCLLGLLPLSMTSFRQSMSNTIEPDIVQSISNDLRLDNFSVVKSYLATPPPPTYYDNEGTLLPNQTGAFYTAAMTIYQITTPIEPTATTPLPAYTVSLLITNVADHTVYTQAHPHQYFLLIADNGQ